MELILKACDDSYFDFNDRKNTKKTIRRATFAKQMYQFQKDGIFYKSANEALSEVKHFLCIIFGMCMRFYNSLISQRVLDKMKEDIIDALSNLVFDEKVCNLCIALC